MILAFAPGCSTNHVDRVVDGVRDVFTSQPDGGRDQDMGENTGTPPPIDQKGVNWAIGAIAGAGAVFVIAGMLSLVASAIPVIKFAVSPHLSWTLILCGTAMVVGAFALPRWSVVIESHIAEYLIYYVGLTLTLASWAGSLYAMRKLTWSSAYRLGYKDGEDGYVSGSRTDDETRKTR